MVDDENVKENSGVGHLDDGENVEVDVEKVKEKSGDGHVDDGHNVEVGDEKVEDMSGDGYVGDGHVADGQNIEVNDEISIYEDYVASKDNGIPFGEEFEGIYWTKVLPPETLGEVSSSNQQRTSII